MADMVQQVAAKAVIINNKDQVLLLRESAKAGRSKVGQYQIVGGRVEMGESFDEALKREVLEETGLRVTPLHPLYIGEWKPVLNGVIHHIFAIFVVCQADSETVTLSDEHDDYLWIDAKKRKDFPVMEPDCFVVDRYAEWSAKDLK